MATAERCPFTHYLDEKQLAHFGLSGKPRPVQCERPAGHGNLCQAKMADGRVHEGDERKGREAGQYVTWMPGRGAEAPAKSK